MESAGAVSMPRPSSLGGRLEFRSLGGCGRPSKTQRESFNSRRANANHRAFLQRSAMAHQVPRNAPMGQWVLINGTWHETLAMGAIFTVVSIARPYCLRRVFEGLRINTK